MPTLHMYWSRRHSRAEQERIARAVGKAVGGASEVVIWYHWFNVEDIFVDGVRLDRIAKEAPHLAAAAETKRR